MTIAAAPPDAATEGPVAAAIPRRGYSRELLLAAGSVLLVLTMVLGIEWVLRWVGPAYLRERPQFGLGVLHRYSEVYGWEPRPGAVANIEGQLFTINRRGWRGLECQHARTSSRTRLLVLGDSIAFGYGVSDEATFAARLERRGYEVVNLAVAGYGTDQSLLRLEREGVAYSPDVVLLHFCLHNDFVDNASRTYFYDGLHPKPYFRLEGEQLVPHLAHLHLTPTARTGLWLHEHSFLYNLVAGRPPPLESDWLARRSAALRDQQTARDLTVRLVQRVARVARETHASFLLVVHPGRRQAREGSPWLTVLRRAPELRDVRQLDMAEAFAERGNPLPELTLDPIGHLNVTGHAQAAVILDETLRDVLSRR